MFLSPVVLDVLRCASEAHTLPEQQWEGRRAMGGGFKSQAQRA